MENINISALKNALIKPFNYAEYVKNPSRKVITRDGYKVKSIKFSPEEGAYPITITRKGEPYTHDAIFCDERLAEDFGKVDKDYITTIKIEWEE